MRKSVFAVAVMALMGGSYAFAQVDQSQVCDPATQSCIGTFQNQGDVSTVYNSGDPHSTTSQLGNSSGSVASGVSIDPSIKGQQDQNLSGSVDGSITGGNTSSDAKATGNSSTNTNSTGPSTAVAGVGDTSSNSGGNILGNESKNDNANKNDSSAASNSGGNVLGNDSSNQNIAKGGASSADHSGNSSNSNRTASAASSKQSSEQAQSTKTNSSVDKAGNSNVGVIAGNDLSTNITKVDARTLLLPDMPATPPTVISSAQMIKETTACGPLQSVDSQPVTQVLRGGFLGWGWKEVDAGTTMHLTERLDAEGRHLWFYEAPIPGTSDVYLFGNQQVIVYAVLGAGSAVQTGAGGGGSNMNWGQLAAGTSGSSQRMVADIQNKLCFLGKATYKVVTPKVIQNATE